MGGKSKSTSNSVQSTSAYAPIQPVLNQGANIMKNYLSNPNSTAVYQGPRVADLSSDTQAGLQQLRDSTGANAAQNYLTNLLSTPSDVANNPEVQALQDAIRRQVQATSNSTFSNAGVVGGTANQTSLAKGLADGLAQPLFQAYQNDQANKLQAAGLLPTVGQQIIDNQVGAGQITDSYNQSKINADMQKFLDEQQAPLQAWNAVAPTATQIGSQFGTTTGQSTTTQQQPLSSTLLGGALAAAGMASGIPGLTTGLSALGGMIGGSAPNVGLAPWTYSLSR